MIDRAAAAGYDGAMSIEQAIYGGQDVGGYRFLARSPGFQEGWLPAAEQLCIGFGERPAGVACPLAVFARPFGPRVAVVQAADQGRDDAGRPGALAFHLLVLPRRLYADLGADPFRIADAFPPPWQVRGELPPLEWTAGPPSRRTVEQLARVLDVAPERTALLLGGVQALLDGGRLAVRRPAPDPDLLRDLWALLPNSSRADLWPASFVFGNAHGFHAVAAPDVSGPPFAGYVTETQAGDYPEGHYEMALQHAVEHGNQADLDGLLARRSRRQTLRLAILLLLAFLIIPPLVLNAPIGRRGPPPRKPDEAKQDELRLPAADAFPPLEEEERGDMSRRLVRLAARLGGKLPPGTSAEELGGAVVALDRLIDGKLWPWARERDPGPLADLGAPARRLRALLWKHGVAEYAQMKLNTAELFERLDQALATKGLLKEEGGD